jgi:hypothetical protein
MSHQRSLQMQRLQALQTCVVDRQGLGLDVRWGCWLHLNESCDGLAVTTLGGETATLTQQMVRALHGFDLLAGGRTPTRLWLPGDPVDLTTDLGEGGDLFDEMILVESVVIAPGCDTGWAGLGGFTRSSSVWSLAEIAACPWLFLASRRPSRWPR